MAPNSKAKSLLTRHNLAHARALWPAQCSKLMLKVLRELTTTFGFSIASGEIKIIDGHWYVTHSGLLRLANRRLCNGIRVEPVPQFSDPATSRWVFKSIVHKSRNSRGFVGFGDADPSNVSPLVRGAEMRVAETRAVNRALRKAYGIGLCSVEELGWASESPKSACPLGNSNGSHASNGPKGSNGSHGSPTRLRDHLCLLIRQYNLDPTLVKEYAAHFCGTETLKGASRELVESFISHLSSSAKEDIDGLICELNSFSRPMEGKQ
jgi:hypothetical protein